MNSFFVSVLLAFVLVNSTTERERETNLLIFRKLSPLRSLAMNQTSSDGHSNYLRWKQRRRSWKSSFGPKLILCYNNRWISRYLYKLTFHQIPINIHSSGLSWRSLFDRFMSSNNSFEDRGPHEKEQTNFRRCFRCSRQLVRMSLSLS